MEQNREQTISRVTAWGAVGNLVLAAFKLLAGVVGRSSAMLADAVHSLSDLVSDVIVLVMVKVSSKAADKDHDYGHGKYETLATVVVALMLVMVGAKLMAEGIQKIRLVVAGGVLAVPGSVALWAALVSIGLKELLYQWTARVGKRMNSPAMITNAWHHRTDALSSIGSAIGIGCALAFGGKWAILDPIVCCMISIFIIVVAVKMTIPALHELTEGSLPDDMEAQIVEIIGSVPGVEDVHGLKTRRNGPAIIIGVHIVVDPNITVAAAHHITELAEDALRERFGQETQISIHIEPHKDAR
ncbi:MAG: cation diffusion facilitator family transporter [Bacteroidales bacterium]|nr:cation diffusion facilitator family transporter [Bacteroidales bacterium]